MPAHVPRNTLIGAAAATFVGFGYLLGLVSQSPPADTPASSPTSSDLALPNLTSSSFSPVHEAGCLHSSQYDGSIVNVTVESGLSTLLTTSVSSPLEEAESASGVRYSSVNLAKRQERAPARSARGPQVSKQLKFLAFTVVIFLLIRFGNALAAIAVAAALCFASLRLFATLHLASLRNFFFGPRVDKDKIIRELRQKITNTQILELALEIIHKTYSDLVRKFNNLQVEHDRKANTIRTVQASLDRYMKMFYEQRDQISDLRDQKSALAVQKRVSEQRAAAEYSILEAQKDRKAVELLEYGKMLLEDDARTNDTYAQCWQMEAFRYELEQKLRQLNGEDYKTMANTLATFEEELTAEHNEELENLEQQHVAALEQVQREKEALEEKVKQLETTTPALPNYHRGEASSGNCGSTTGVATTEMRSAMDSGTPKTLPVKRSSTQTAETPLRNNNSDGGCNSGCKSTIGDGATEKRPSMVDTKYTFAPLASPLSHETTGASIGSSCESIIEDVKIEKDSQTAPIFRFGQPATSAEKIDSAGSASGPQSTFNGAETKKDAGLIFAGFSYPLANKNTGADIGSGDQSTTTSANAESSSQNTSRFRFGPTIIPQMKSADAASGSAFGSNSANTMVERSGNSDIATNAAGSLALPGRTAGAAASKDSDSSTTGAKAEKSSQTTSRRQTREEEYNAHKKAQVERSTALSEVVIEPKKKEYASLVDPESEESGTLPAPEASAASTASIAPPTLGVNTERRLATRKPKPKVNIFAPPSKKR